MRRDRTTRQVKETRKGQIMRDKSEIRDEKSIAENERPDGKRMRDETRQE